ncbi:MAG: ABC transporter ATP-binding protein [Halioglobus sp.]
MLTSEQRGELRKLQVLVVIMAILELISVASIAPFMSAIGDMESLQGSGLLAQLYSFSGLKNPQQFVFWSGVLVIISISSAAIFSAITVWKLTIYGQKIGSEFSTRLFSHFMGRDWSFHLRNSSSHLTSTIANDCSRITQGIIIPALNINARIVLTCIMGCAILVIDPIAGILGIVIFCSLYILLYVSIRRRLMIFGREISESNTKRMRLMNEGFGGIKAIILSNRQQYFNRRFQSTSNTLSRAQGLSQSLALLPRSLIELLAFGSVILLILYLLQAHESDLGIVLPILSIYALAGFKLLPALQIIYNGVSTIRSNLSALDEVEKGLKELKYQSQELHVPDRRKKCIARGIKLENVSYTHINAIEPTIKDLSISIPAGQTIGLVGPSGGGKSTLVDILIGLAVPQKGNIFIDNQPIQKFGSESWRANIGYVPQSIFLADTSIRENIAFGIEPDLIQDHRVDQVCKMANLSALLESLPAGLNTTVGEHGEQISGGQRQRIGIARALYEDPGVLFFDEATSALDGINEKVVMESVADLSGERTIVLVAHRINTLRNCNCIFIIDGGRVIESGTFDELAKNSSFFRDMGGFNE